MKKTSLSIFAFAAILCFSKTATAQWTQSGSEVTSSSSDLVGIGTTTALSDKLTINGGLSFQAQNSNYRSIRGSAPYHGLSIYSDNSFVNGSAIIMSSYSHSTEPGEIKLVAGDGGTGTNYAISLRTYDNGNYTPRMIINKMGQVGIGTTTLAANNILTVGGNATINGAATIWGNTSIDGHILFHPQNIDYRVIQGASGNHGLVAYADQGFTSGSALVMNSYNHSTEPGEIKIVAADGGSGTDNAITLRTYDAGNFTPRMSIRKDGVVTIPNLSNGSSEMVVANASGVLSTQPIPTFTNTDNQTLSISGSNLSITGGNTVTLPTGADNLGDHRATKDLNMGNHNIHSLKEISTDKIIFTPGAGFIEYNGGSKDIKISVAAGFPSTGKLTVEGDIDITGEATCNSNAWNGSDRRFKKNIEEMQSIKETLFNIQPYTYDFRVGEIEGKHFNSKHQFGFIAQEVEKVFPNLTKVGKDGYYAINYDGFIPLLLQALKEEDKLVQEQLTTIKTLEEKLALLEEKVNQLSAGKTLSTGNVIGSTTVKSSLNQNVPNPFNNETKIGFNIVGKYETAFIGIYDLNGREVKQIAIQQGAKDVVFSKNNLQSGMYVYSLVVDNKLIDSKRMIFAD